MSERHAWICTHKSCVPPHRIFVGPDDPKPACPEHGRHSMVLQANQPYRGKPT
jgi:hypothetical protein